MNTIQNSVAASINSNYFIDLFSFLLHSSNLIVAHGRDKSQRQHLATLKGSLDLTSEVLRIRGKSNILTGVSFVVHKAEVTILLNVGEGILLSNNSGNIGGVGGRNNIFVLLAVKNINSSEVALSVSVLSSLGGGNGRHLARSVLHGHETGKEKRKTK